MKTFALAVAVLACCLLAFQPQAKAQSYPTYSGFSTDQVEPGGIYGSKLQSYLDGGWLLLVTTVDVPGRLVQFRNSSTGALEWRVGTIPAGTSILVHTGMQEVRIQMCGNIAQCYDDVLKMYGGLSLPSES